MRIGEAIGLRIKNVDFAAGVLTIQGAKFGKLFGAFGYCPTLKVLSEYKSHRDEYLQGCHSDYFFINKVGKALDQGAVRRTFYRLSRRCGLRGKRAKKGPRIHDFRHRFAVQTLLLWYRNGDDVERLLPVLSTYLGHVHVSDTYWYLTAYPELMGQAVKRLQKRWEVKS